MLAPIQLSHKLLAGILVPRVIKTQLFDDPPVARRAPVDRI
jgi:hypothetical protein